MSDLRNIVITGGTKGLGYVYAKHLSKIPGNQIIITGRNKTPPVETESLLSPTFHYRSLDVANEQEIIPFFLSVRKDFGHIDVLLNNAGVWGPVGKFNTNAIDEWIDALKINLSGVVRCTHAAINIMEADRHNIIINMVSNAGAYRWPTCSSYSVSKAAVIKFTENIAIELKKNNISVYAFHPGLVHSTGMVINLFSNPPEEQGATRNAMEWIIKEKERGNTVSVEAGIPNIEKLCSGKYESLSGFYLTEADDLDAISSDIRKIRKKDFYQLRVNK